MYPDLGLADARGRRDEARKLPSITDAQRWL
ncbi:hypothetical protein ABQJ56_09495 [Rhodanobacter sp. S2-g]|uniref:Integrase n=1 Tax=Rhodanobacter geophilus TaxID=3162488 RepID=A0ABV3QPD1_9GAMM